MQQLAKLTKTRFVTRHGNNQRAQISFEWPELSLCLSKLDINSEPYRAALALIIAGQKRLTQTPRGDMPGFQPCEQDLKRLRKHLRRQEIENANRKAIRDGKKVYDQDF